MCKCSTRTSHTQDSRTANLLYVSVLDVEVGVGTAYGTNCKGLCAIVLVTCAVSCQEATVKVFRDSSKSSRSLLCVSLNCSAAVHALSSTVAPAVRFVRASTFLSVAGFCRASRPPCGTNACAGKPTQEQASSRLVSSRLGFHFLKWSFTVFDYGGGGSRATFGCMFFCAGAPLLHVSTICRPHQRAQV